MKIIITLIFLFFGYLSVQDIHSAPVNVELARQIALSQIMFSGNDSHQIENIAHYSEKEQPLFFLIRLNPAGYIVISADTDLPPVIAYSFANDVGDESESLLINLLKADLGLRYRNIPKLPAEIIKIRHEEWEMLSGNPVCQPKEFQQWPPEGTTATGGWLETNWTQNAPYNNFCPMDPVTNQRSIAGCPAVAMAMIVNYYQTLNETEFTDDDDYYHSYSGRNYWIDDDHKTIDFPSFTELNHWFDTLTLSYANQSPLKPELMAALTFSCGVAAKQVYTSSISGTFGVEQAYDAYFRFGFGSALLKYDNDTSLYDNFMLNMMEGRPVHLAVVDPAGTMGHNVVLDGYNTDGFFHLNFGWGGTYNGWYKLPEEIPYGLTVIEGAVVDIAYPPVNTWTLNNDIPLNMEIYPNPATDHLTIVLKSSGPVRLQIANSTGEIISDQIHSTSLIKNDLSIKLDLLRIPDLKTGIYLCRISNDQGVVTRKFIRH